MTPWTGPGESGDPNLDARSGTRNRAAAPIAMNAAISAILRAVSAPNLRPRERGRQAPAPANARNTRTAIAFSETLYSPPPSRRSRGRPRNYREEAPWP